MYGEKEQNILRTIVKFGLERVINAIVNLNLLNL